MSIDASIDTDLLHQHYPSLFIQDYLDFPPLSSVFIYNVLIIRCCHYEGYIEVNIEIDWLPTSVNKHGDGVFSCTRK